MVRSKRPNVELDTHAFCACASTSTRITRVVKEHENLLCCEIVFDTLTSLRIHMQSHQEVSSYVSDWDGDSDRSSCSPLFEALTPNKNFSNLNVDAFVATAAPKASTLGLFSRTTNVPSYAFISFPYRC